MKPACGCCEGIEASTPLATANRPGLAALAYRVGTHASFLETMLARLSSTAYPELAALATRETADASIALLDAWACAADVLTFYQERIANEGYLRTATERRSILELARLVGYRPRPGVAASVYLAYTIEKDSAPVEIPKGARANSVPGPGEQMQSFETSEPLAARHEWNALQPRMSRPQTEAAIRNGKLYLKGTATNLKPHDPLLIDFGLANQDPQPFRIRELAPDDKAERTFAGVRAWGGAALARGDLLTLVARFTDLDRFGVSAGAAMTGRVLALLNELGMRAAQAGAVELATFLQDEILPKLSEEADVARANRFVRLDPWLDGMIHALSAVHDRLARAAAEAAVDGADAAAIGGTAAPAAIASSKFTDFLDLLAAPPSIPPAGPKQLERTVAATFGARSDIYPRLLTKLQPRLGPVLYRALANTAATPEPGIVVHALRKSCAVFGHNAPKKPILDEQGIVKDHEEWPLAGSLQSVIGLATAGGNPVSVTVAARTGAERRSATARLGANVVDNRESVELALGTLSTVKITVAYEESAAGLRIAREVRVLFAGVNRGAIFKLRTQADPLIVHVRGADHRIDPGERLDTTEGGARIAIVSRGARGEETISVLEDAPLPPDPKNVIALDAVYEKIVPQGWAIVERADLEAPIVARVTAVQTVSKADYGITGRVTQLTLDRPWLSDDDLLLTVFRGATVHVLSEILPLAEEPITEPVCGKELELGALYDGLESGRWLIIAGERADIAGTEGVRAAELLMLAGVTHGMQTAEDSGADRTRTRQALKGDKLHSFITFAKEPRYCYKRDTVTLYGNVIAATHGETRNEVLGGGDAAKAWQAFVLKQPPLTWTSAPTVSGVQSTLEVRVDDVQWHEADTLAELAPDDRKFITQDDDDAKTSVIFGNGERGARLPTGPENIKAVYRNGIGKPGNVQAEQISLLAAKPLGVKAVINPMRASGGADKESRDQARRNAPLAVAALDRLVSTQDYADFARTFAGIGKASAARLSDGRRQLVHVTIAGDDDIPIDETSDLFRNLKAALSRFGDPYLPPKIEVRELLALVVSANIRVLPDHRWDTVEPKVRAALLDTFGFERRELGQDVTASELIAVMQRVPGVDYVDLDLLDAIDEARVIARLARQAETADGGRAGGGGRIGGGMPAVPRGRVRAHAARIERNAIRPAQLAFLQPGVPDTLLLNEVRP
ncbi:MAG TPA: putative baseplate assembly protein [Paucimonas sp.]|nr:putative baseplate assembly protein [Paucimonas sp.]